MYDNPLPAVASTPSSAPPMVPLAGHVVEQAVVHRIGPNETLVSLADAARLLPRIAGKKVNLSTVWRWARVGLRGVRLEYVRVGRKICTSHEALLRFFAALAKLDARLDPSQYATPTFVHRAPITSQRRLRALQQADEVLARAGI